MNSPDRGCVLQTYHTRYVPGEHLSFRFALKAVPGVEWAAIALRCDASSRLRRACRFRRVGRLIDAYGSLERLDLAGEQIRLAVPP